MTTHKNKKRRVRARMEKTGESYQPAHRAVERAGQPAVGGDPTVTGKSLGTPSANTSTDAAAETPDFGDELPMIPMRNAVLFPGAVVPFDIGRVKSLAAIEKLNELPSPVFAVFAQRDPSTDDPEPSDLYPMGCAARLLKAKKHDSGNYTIIAEGLTRIRLGEFIEREPFVRVRISRVETAAMADADTERLATTLRSAVKETLALFPDPPKAPEWLESSQPAELADLVAANLDAPVEKKIELLETLDVNERMQRTGNVLERQLAVLKTEEGQLNVRADRRRSSIWMNVAIEGDLNLLLTKPDLSSTGQDSAPVLATGDAQFGNELPVIPLHNHVLVPGQSSRCTIDRAKSAAVLEKLKASPNPVIAVFFLRDPATDDPEVSDLHPIGCAARVLKADEERPGYTSLWLRGLKLIRLESITHREPYPQARIGCIEGPSAFDAETERVATALRDVAKQVLALVAEPSPEVAEALDAQQTPAELVDRVTRQLGASPAHKIELVQIVDLKRRMRRTLELLEDDLTVLNKGKP